MQFFWLIISCTSSLSFLNYSVLLHQTPVSHTLERLNVSMHARVNHMLIIQYVMPRCILPHTLKQRFRYVWVVFSLYTQQHPQILLSAMLNEWNWGDRLRKTRHTSSPHLSQLKAARHLCERESVCESMNMYMLEQVWNSFVIFHLEGNIDRNCEQVCGACWCEKTFIIYSHSCCFKPVWLNFFGVIQKVFWRIS